MTNQSVVALSDPALQPLAYRDELLSILGDRDPLTALAQTPDRIRELLRTVSGDVWTRRPANGEWSATEIVGHLLDDDIIFAFRMRMALTADQPSYPGTDPERWALLPGLPLAESLRLWKGLRAYNLSLLHTIPRDEWQRTALHAEQGPESVAVNVRKTAGHDLAHLNQLERTLLG